MTGVGAPRSAVPQLLLDLVTNPLDPGYAAAATRRAAGEPAPRRSGVLLALGCLLAGFVLVLAYQVTHRGEPEAAKVHERLVQRVRQAQAEASGLSAQLTRIDSQVAAAQAQALPPSDALSKLVKQESLVAGYTAVTGPGLTVTLDDPHATPTTAPGGRAGSLPITATTTLTDRDVRSVVNELWHDGAEAIAVNGIRLTPTSAIRFAGETVLVDFQPVTAPYRIQAVGSRDGLSTEFAQSAVASRYQTLIGVEGISFSFADSGSLSLPAGSPVSPRYATAAPK